MWIHDLATGAEWLVAGTATPGVTGSTDLVIAFGDVRDAFDPADSSNFPVTGRPREIRPYVRPEGPMLAGIVGLVHGRFLAETGIEVLLLPDTLTPYQNLLGAEEERDGLEAALGNSALGGHAVRFFMYASFDTFPGLTSLAGEPARVGFAITRSLASLEPFVSVGLSAESITAYVLAHELSHALGVLLEDTVRPAHLVLTNVSGARRRVHVISDGFPHLRIRISDPDLEVSLGELRSRDYLTVQELTDAVNLLGTGVDAFVDDAGLPGAGALSVTSVSAAGVCPPDIPGLPTMNPAPAYCALLLNPSLDWGERPEDQIDGLWYGAKGGYYDLDPAGPSSVLELGVRDGRYVMNADPRYIEWITSPFWFGNVLDAPTISRPNTDRAMFFHPFLFGGEP